MSVARRPVDGNAGVILVEPEGGLPHVDREFYVMQGGTLHSQAIRQRRGDQEMDYEKLISERPGCFLFNGAAVRTHRESSSAPGHSPRETVRHVLRRRWSKFYILVGFLIVDGPLNDELMHQGPAIRP